jgi:DNA-binding transcriptional LysR family regulator
VHAPAMNIRNLEVFKAVMESGSTTTAGRNLELSQSAISRQLSGLEDDLGFPLFEREKGRLVSTAEAAALLPHVVEVLDGFARMKRRAEDLKAGTAGDLLVKAAFPHSLSATLLPAVIARFNEQRPSVAIEILNGPYDAVERMVADREADIGFVRLPTEESGFHVVPLIRSRMVCAMPADHKLAEKSEIGLADFAGVDLVLIGRKRAPGRELDQNFRRMRLSARCLIEAHSVETACGLVAAGLGVSIVPALIGNLFAGPTIALRPLAGSHWHDYGIIARHGPISAAATVLIEQLRAAFASVTFETELL